MVQAARRSVDTSLLYTTSGSLPIRAHKSNPDSHTLAAFLKLVEAGKIPKGSYLIIENLDRLSREEERPALRLWMDILDAGINIVQLSPEAILRHETSDMFDIMRAIMELSRGHGETPSNRNGRRGVGRQKDHARRGLPQPAKKEDRVNGMAILTHRLPAWVEECGGELRLIPARAAIVRRIFALAAGGYGLASIVQRLTAEKVPTMGRGGVCAGPISTSSSPTGGRSASYSRSVGATASRTARRSPATSPPW